MINVLLYTDDYNIRNISIYYTLLSFSSVLTKYTIQSILTK